MFSEYSVALLYLIIINNKNYSNFNDNGVNKKECDCLSDSDGERGMEAVLGVNNEKRMNHEKKSLKDEAVANGNTSGSSNGSDSDIDGDGCYTKSNDVTTTVFITSSTSTRTITATSERVVSNLPTVTATLTSTITSYRPTNDITNDSTHASNVMNMFIRRINMNY
ncbi:hypothetical protein H8356DRAFT_1089829 [Neocallimastix lanati (nom. inval.)]|uniref:Uncharacterized protein n=1 Tax=Neocallimastix californiae TaxID=1754190 RepID=A0A1Y2FGJ5_9FUNG|nr:hypothetical protein H8356DRAFT_1089829 [Neocallimastix sp. JGI-2020a]ORY82737.1 hypothetical protein LY90DRAFT_499699 [Neocallimastix californiae]|eukprot:ORY82737.1 hypothetical protein LY90DRAFT_499699 [Neocallimastix californiae]